MQGLASFVDHYIALGGGGGADVEAGLAEYKSFENEHFLGPVKKGWSFINAKLQPTKLLGIQVFWHV